MRSVGSDVQVLDVVVRLGRQRRRVFVLGRFKAPRHVDDLLQGKQHTRLTVSYNAT